LTGGTAVPGRHQKHQGKHRPQGRQHLLKVRLNSQLHPSGLHQPLSCGGGLTEGRALGSGICAEVSGGTPNPP